ncbi:hypothetical protein THAOC_14313, partial [Thalassiosira oceanica]
AEVAARRQAAVAGRRAQQGLQLGGGGGADHVGRRRAGLGGRRRGGGREKGALGRVTTREALARSAGKRGRAAGGFVLCSHQTKSTDERLRSRTDRSSRRQLESQSGSMDPSRSNQGDEGRKLKLKGCPSPVNDTGLKALLDQHSEQMRRMQSQIDGLVAINSTLQARLDGQAGSQAREVDELRVKCNVLESRCGSLERSIQVLKKDVNWKYTAPDIPRSHWIEQGHDREYADNMKGCLRRIKGHVERIRNGENIYCSCLDYDGELTILHDDALQPHFKELADAIQLSNGIRRINIDNLELRPSALGILFPAMEGKVKRIDMRRIRIPVPDAVKCYEIISSSIRRNHALERLLWIGIQIPSDDQADLLMQSLIENRAIKDIRLEKCFNLSNNSITSAGFEKIRSTIYDPSSLNAMESCNHTCYVDCMGGNVYNMTPRQRRNQKLYKLLSTRHLDGSNARLLNAEFGDEKYTIKLVPKVLHCIKHYSSDQPADSPTPLSITFELIKTWMMPEIF